MGGHDQFEIGIERRLHGDSSPQESAALDAHLAGCEACRVFEATARRTEDAMQQRAAAVLEGYDWNRIEARVRSMRARVRNRPLRILIFSAILFTLLEVVVVIPEHRPQTRMLGVAVAFTAFSVFSYFFNRERERAAARAADSRVELLIFYQSELDWRIRIETIARALIPVFVAAGIWKGVSLIRDGEVRAGAFMTALCALFVGIEFLLHRQIRLWKKLQQDIGPRR
jgi:anti-sigma factor RsiW